MTDKIKKLELELERQNKRVDAIKLQLELLLKKKEEEDEHLARKIMQNYRIAVDKQLIERVRGLLSLSLFLILLRF